MLRTTFILTQHMRYYPFAHTPLIYYTYTEYLYHKQLNEERYSTLPFNHQKIILPHIPCSALQNALNINI